MERLMANRFPGDLRIILAIIRIAAPAIILVGEVKVVGEALGFW
jgi:hypothetical protein